MRRVHFYKAKTRLGIINPPIHQKDRNIGVEDAPDAILTKDFLSYFYNAEVSEFTFSKPEEIIIGDCFAASERLTFSGGARNDNGKKCFDVLADELKSFKNLINKTLKSGETQVVIGGDNSITFSSLLALLERVKDTNKIGYIQFDSHGEMNLYKTSPTKNFHGMYLRPFLDTFDVPKIRSLIHTKLIRAHTLFIGDIELDREERAYFEKTRLRNITTKMVLENTDKVAKELKDFISEFKYLHINFDIDVFTSLEAPATGIPSIRGFKFSQIVKILQIISAHPNLSLDLSEVNPLKKGKEKTIKVAQAVLISLLSHPPQ